MSQKNKMDFKLEIALLDKAQSGLFEAIASKPDPNDIEAMRLYLDNVYMVMNKCVTLVKDTKNALQNKQAEPPLTETYNSPA
jgi:hypothetical protein